MPVICPSCTKRCVDHSRAQKARHGFTLVELLVVIGIIALLISILLPSLNNARRAAKTIKCSSNMRQIAQAMVMYTNDNKGRLMPCEIATGVAGTSYAPGWWWAAELVHQKYIVAPTLKPDPATVGAATPTWIQPTDLGVFQCPEALAPEDYNASGAASVGLYPAHYDNRGWARGLSPRIPGMYGNGTTYQLNARLAYANGGTVYSSNWTTGTSGSNNGTNNPPFVYFDSGPPSGNAMTYIKDPNFTRTISNIHHASSLVMIVEATGIGWANQNASVVNGVTHWARGLGARHGRLTADKTNASTNLAFMDGHCETIATAPIDYTGQNGPGVPSGASGVSAQTPSTGAMFTMYMANQ